MPNGRLNFPEKEKKNIADFIIKFDALAMKAETDNTHTIFLLKKNIKTNIINNIRVFTYVNINIA